MFFGRKRPLSPQHTAKQSAPFFAQHLAQHPAQNPPQHPAQHPAQHLCLTSLLQSGQHLAKHTAQQLCKTSPFLSGQYRAPHPATHLCRTLPPSLDSTLHTTFADLAAVWTTPCTASFTALQSTFVKIRHRSLDNILRRTPHSTLHSIFARLRHRHLCTAPHTARYTAPLPDFATALWKAPCTGSCRAPLPDFARSLVQFGGATPVHQQNPHAAHC